MKINYFPIWRKQYLFHPSAIKDKTLISIYQPYNIISKSFWTLWKTNRIFRNFFTTEIEFDILDFLNYITSKYALGENIWVINKGEEILKQKNTILLRSEGSNQKYLFVKTASNKFQKDLVRNEAHYLKSLKKYKFVPELISFEETNKFCYLITNVFHGEKPSNPLMNEQVFNLILEVGEIFIPNASSYSENNIIHKLNHGDFCPWNILRIGNELKVIDWEMAGMYPLGYDLFTYIFQTSYLLHPNESISSILNTNNSWIEKYFSSNNINNWKLYLKTFAEIKYTATMDDKKLTQHFANLIAYLNVSMP